MYAISFDLNIADLEEFYPNGSYNNAYGDIKKFLLNNGFSHKQGSVYFGDESTNAVKTVVTINKMSNQFPWLKNCVSDIRMLRIEEDNDLMPAL